MTSGIAVTPERLREISAQMSAGAADVEAILSRLSGNVAPVRSDWVGAAQAQFNTLWDQLQRDASGLHSVLTGIAKLTENAAAAYEAAELSIAQAFDEFRVGPTKGPNNTGGVSGAAELLPETTMEAGSVAGISLLELADDAADDADQSVGRPKSGVRLPWTRFMTKSVHDSENGEHRVGARLHERRFKTSDPALRSGTRLCRLCFTVVVIEAEYIETTPSNVFLHCPHCERSFPIRRSDVESLLLGQSPI